MCQAINCIFRFRYDSSYFSGISGYFYPEIVFLDHNLTIRCSLLGTTLFLGLFSGQTQDYFFFNKVCHVLFKDKIPKPILPFPVWFRSTRLVSDFISAFPFFQAKVVNSNRNDGVYSSVLFYGATKQLQKSIFKITANNIITENILRFFFALRAYTLKAAAVKLLLFKVTWKSEP